MLSVSVIIPTRNRCRLLVDALASVRAQTHRGTIETWVVDDASCDGTAELLARDWPEVKLLRNDQQVDRAAARNQAIAQATGQLIAFLDDDDVWAPTYLARQAAALADRASFVVSGALIWDSANGRCTPVSQRPDLRRYRSLAHQLLVDSCVVTTSSVLFDAATLRRSGGFDPAQSHGCDLDLYLRCLIAGVEPVFTGEPLAGWRLHATGQSSDLRFLEDKRRAQRERLQRYHAQLCQRHAVPALAQLQAELDARFARRYLYRRALGHWLLLHAACARQGYPAIAATAVADDVRLAAAALAGRLGMRSRSTPIWVAADLFASPHNNSSSSAR